MNRLEAMQKRLQIHRFKTEGKQTELLLVRPSKGYIYRPIENATIDQCSCRCGRVDIKCPYFGNEIKIVAYD